MEPLRLRVAATAEQGISFAKLVPPLKLQRHAGGGARLRLRIIASAEQGRAKKTTRYGILEYMDRNNGVNPSVPILNFLVEDLKQLLTVSNRDYN